MYLFFYDTAYKQSHGPIQHMSNIQDCYRVFSDAPEMIPYIALAYTDIILDTGSVDTYMYRDNYCHLHVYYHMCYLWLPGN